MTKKRLLATVLATGILIAASSSATTVMLLTALQVDAGITIGHAFPHPFSDPGGLVTKGGHISDPGPINGKRPFVFLSSIATEVLPTGGVRPCDDSSIIENCRFFADLQLSCLEDDGFGGFQKCTGVEPMRFVVKTRSDGQFVFGLSPEGHLNMADLGHPAIEHLEPMDGVPASVRTNALYWTEDGLYGAWIDSEGVRRTVRIVEKTGMLSPSCGTDDLECGSGR